MLDTEEAAHAAARTRVCLAAPLRDPHRRPQTGNFGDQMGWLEKELAAAAAARAAGTVSWIIVGGHRPIYSRVACDAAGTPTAEAAALRAAVEPLLLKYGADVYVCGHEHS
jgi:hypothetical protein